MGTGGPCSLVGIRGGLARPKRQQEPAHTGHPVGHVEKLDFVLGAGAISCACHVDRGSERASRDTGEAVAWWELGGPWGGGGEEKGRLGKCR